MTEPSDPVLTDVDTCQMPTHLRRPTLSIASVWCPVTTHMSRKRTSPREPEPYGPTRQRTRAYIGP